MTARQASLLEPDFPDGFRYQDEFLTTAEEWQLVSAIEHVEFATFEMRGVVAKRRVAFFGRTYGERGGGAPPIPDFLLPYRERIAAWSGVEARRYVMALINEFPPGAPIGWHRDAPQYDVVAGLSLGSPCRMMLRPYVRPSARQGGGPPRRATHEVTLAPRSVYLLSRTARTGYEHHIPPVARLRYSVTFRTAPEKFE